MPHVTILPQDLIAEKSLHQLYTCIVYSCIVFASTHFARWIGQTCLDADLEWKFNELLSTLARCSCLWSEGIILAHYGYIAMFITIVIHRKLAEWLSNGAGENASILVEEGVARDRMFFGDRLWLTVIQMFTALFSYIYAAENFGYAGKLTGFPALGKLCLLNETISLVLVGVAQFVGAFSLRFVLHRTATPELKKYQAGVYAFFFVTSHYLTGVTGLDPILCLAMVYPCTMKQENIFMKYLSIYLLCLNSGYTISARLCGEYPLRSIHRQRFEVAEEARIAALPPPSPPAPKFVGKGNRRRQVR
ncbi:hypothetical protein CRE_23755 [Caenorhabditis remanei]|uniref:Uncharacterized protein n=1 Tax=Caenorhabditis remanei TaxID=31234 RepID=E3NHR9_CAERE|nr:hypothetical protein CRE_23755 [Caenorhabditis remanei]